MFGKPLISVIALLISNFALNSGKQINATCSWGEPNSGHINPFACYVRVPFTLHENDTLYFVSEIERSEILELNFWLPPASRSQWDISFIPRNIFKTFPNLRSFIVPGRVKEIFQKDFQAAHQLKQVAISDQLKVIPSNVFVNLNKLEKLDLSWNKICAIEENAFDGLQNLRSLRLNRNQLRKLTSLTFTGAGGLKELIINTNKIEQIEDGTFMFPHLKMLDLSHNKIKQLSDETFRHCIRLETLDLKSNDLTKIERSTYHLANLQYLNLDNNRIADINLRMFAQMPNLEHLSLENNGQALNDSILITGADTTISTARPIVKTLYLSGNGLKNRDILARLWALGITQLENLHIDNNAYEHIDFYPISAFPKLREINLGKNYWKCEWLNETLQRLEEDNIAVNLFSSRFPQTSSEKHVNFIQCI